MKKRYIAAGLVALALLGGAALLKAVARRRSLQLAAPAAPTARASVSLEVAQVVYDGKLAEGWEDWGWGRHELPALGPANIDFSGYGGIVFHHAALQAHFSGFAVRYRVPSDWPEFLAVSLKGPGADESVFLQVPVAPRHVARLADGWREALIDLRELNPRGAAFDRIVLTARVPLAPGRVLLDKIVLTQEKSAAVGSAPPTGSAQLSILCRAPTHRINSLIYGGTGSVSESAQSGHRIGGNPLTRLNWDLGNAWNTGSDWFFENVTVDGNLERWLDDAFAHQRPTALVVPMIGWVAKDGVSVGFPKAKFAKQRAFDDQRATAGDGYLPNASPIQPGVPTETSVAAPPELVGHWIDALRGRDRARGARRVDMYILDNEPSLWNVTHRDVHPAPVTYDELLDRTIRYGTEIRKADSEAVIAGPAEWGWTAYFDSAKDKGTGPVRPDRRAHGDMPLIPFYLKKLAEHEASTGTRILDVLDVHFYPAADGVYGTNARTDLDAAALRIRSTRALWDPGYRDESWINEPIQLIPRLKAWVAANYPGRLVSLGEWSFGADEHISGGLATAEALGRFGQQGLDAAYFWGGPKVGTAAYWAFRAYRDFDGAGGRFLDISLATREQENISLFASRDDAGSRIVAIVVNRDPTFELHAHIVLDGCGRTMSRRAFSYGAHSKALQEEAVAPVAAESLEESIPPYSFRVLDIRFSPPGPSSP